MNRILEEIYNWFDKNRRDLPWRKTSDPYKIWISEIILQQTRVVQGTNYYLRFIRRFPTIQSLAGSSENEVLKMWQGLGYYTRARNLHAAAQFIVNNFNGVFPSDYNLILNLRGVGNYTAAAIASIAFDLPYPVVDGNIYRFLTRYYGITTPIDSLKGKKEILEVATELMPKTKPGFHNQALMEFGALQCVPKSPKCENCPLLETCFAAQKETVAMFPVKTKKIKQSTRFFYYYIIDAGNSTFLDKRTKNDIWKNLYQFPLFESDRKCSEKEILSTENIDFLSKCSVNIKKVSGYKKHILSHQVILARFIYLEIENPNCLSGKFIQVNKKDIYKFAVPRLLEVFINEIETKEN